MPTLKTLVLLSILLLGSSLAQMLSHFLAIDESQSLVPINEVRCCSFKQLPALGFEGEWQGRIPATPEPRFIDPEGISWIKPKEPVVVLSLDGEVKAYPVQILVHHEVVNDELAGVPIAITLCPICNSAIAIDRRIPLTALQQQELLARNPEASLAALDEMFVERYRFQHGDDSQLLSHVLASFHSAAGYNGNMMMIDSHSSTLWSQLLGKALVGTLRGSQLLLYPAQMMGFAEFKRLYPEGLVLSKETGIERSYGYNPFLGFDDIDNPPLNQPDLLDGRLRAKARVANVHWRDEAVAYPFAILEQQKVINDLIAQHPVVVFWQEGTANSYGRFFTQEGQEVGGTAVFSRQVAGRSLSFYWDGEHVVDDETESCWNLAGQAFAGPLSGEQLQAIVHDNTLWYAWVRFFPETRVYSVEDTTLLRE